MPAQPPHLRSEAQRNYKGEEIEVGNQEAADKIVAAVSNAKWQVASVTQKEKKRNPPPPFHHFETAAGCLQSPALHGQAHHVARAAPL